MPSAPPVSPKGNGCSPALHSRPFGISPGPTLFPWPWHQGSAKPKSCRPHWAQAGSSNCLQRTLCICCSILHLSWGKQQSNQPGFPYGLPKSPTTLWDRLIMVYFSWELICFKPNCSLGSEMRAARGQQYVLYGNATCQLQEKEKFGSSQEEGTGAGVSWVSNHSFSSLQREKDGLQVSSVQPFTTHQDSLPQTMPQIPPSAQC